jgi:hypothetical protein
MAAMAGNVNLGVKSKLLIGLGVLLRQTEMGKLIFLFFLTLVSSVKFCKDRVSRKL